MLVLLVSSGLAACSAKHAKSSSSPPASTAPVAATTTTASQLSPLTGLPSANPASLTRPALVVKIENERPARPQAGLEAADVVYEEVIEGGDTRFLAIFQSSDADPVGPVRSVRPTDPDIVRPLGSALFGYAGGTRKFMDLLHQAPVTDVGIDAAPAAYRRRADRRAPHNLYTSTAALYAKGSAAGRPPAALFRFLGSGQPFDPAGAAPVAHLSVAPGSGTTADYDWDAGSGSWKRSTDGQPHLAERGGQLAPTNVIVQFVPYRVSPGDVDTNGSPVLVAQLVGSGDAWVLSGGKLVKAKWSKPAPDAPTTFSDQAGAAIALTPGRTWVELANVGARATTR